MSTDYLVLANARAGRAERGRLRSATRRLERDGAVEVAETADAAELHEALDTLNARRLVVAGGDGSVHVVVARLHELGLLESATLGLIPLGTGNDLARGQGIPLDVGEAADVIVDGRTRAIDVLVDDAGGVVVNAVHAGLGARAAQHSDSLKDSLGPLAYPIGALVAAALEDGWDLSVTVDGDALELDGRLLMVGVANGPSIGGGTPLCPVAEVTDGLLDVVAVVATDQASLVGFGTDLRTGDHLDRDDVRHARGQEVRIHGDPVRFNADGEVSEPLRSRTYRVLPRALALRVPR